MRRRPREEGERWIEQAREDLRWADDLAWRGGYHVACFLAQQVGGKALKAFLYAAGDEVVLGHSIERLCNQVAERHPAIREHARRWSILDAYYVTARYPNSLPESIPARVYTEDAAMEAVRFATEIVRYVEELLESL